MRTKIALLFAVVLGILAVLGIQAYLTQKDQEYEQMATRVSIAIARENLTPGTLLKPTHITQRAVDEAAVTDMHILFDQVKPYIGRQVTQKVPAGKALLYSYFLTPPEREEFATKKIDTSMRAITIGTDQIAGVAGLITPGSHVDVLCTFRMQSRGPESAATIITKIIARNIEVLAVDSRTDVRIPLRGGRRASAFDKGYSSVTLHLTPLEATLLTFAQQTGKLSFALRHVEDIRVDDKVDAVTLSQFDALVEDARRTREDMMRKRTNTRTR